MSHEERTPKVALSRLSFRERRAGRVTCIGELEGVNDSENTARKLGECDESSRYSRRVVRLRKKGDMRRWKGASS
jgi:hypothetical protein